MPTLIFNGGPSLPGAPENWDQARQIEKSFNPEDEDYEGPRWSFDCGFKLDYDGDIVRISSRFYPPAEFYGPKWDGNATISVNGIEVLSKQFECDSVENLRTAVIKFQNEIIEKIKKALIS
jgi:hypothetical protein